MKKLAKQQAMQRKNSDVCVVTEHDVGDELMDFAIVKIWGRYPDSRRVVNQGCKELVYIHEGRGKVVVEGQEYLLNAGDVVLIEPGEKFYWDGKMELFISCRPAFTVEQHQLVD
jgi:mannose-6-phosphate isomerase-like protein (cupin superfamily)